MPSEMHQRVEVRVRRMRAGGQDSMNPATLLRLAAAFTDTRGRMRQRPEHVLRIGAEAGTWPATIYKAHVLGYLERTDPAWFRPSEQLRFEIRRIKAMRKQRGR